MLEAVVIIQVKIIHETDVLILFESIKLDIIQSQLRLS